MRGHEVDARVGAPAAGLVEVAGAGDTRRELREAPLVAAPERPHAVAVLTVPLRPSHRKVPDLVAALAQVPRLGDQLHLGERRVLLHDVEERGEPVDLEELAGQDRRQVEPEAVDVHVPDPVAEAVEDQLHRPRVAHVEAVPRAGEVEVVARVVGIQPVVGRVVDAAQAQRGAEVVALAGVVVDDVQDHLDPGAVEGLHHRLELAHLAPGPLARRVARLRRQEGDRVVAPVVREATLDQVAVVDELMDRQELDRRHAEREQVVDDRVAGHAEVGAAQLRRNAGVAHRHPAHVALVDHGPVPWDGRPAVVAPRERRVDHDALGHVRRA